MKTLLLVLITPFFVLTQKYKYNEDSITNYFINHLDSFRKTLNPNISNVKVNFNASKACEHHNNYMSDMKKDDYSFCSHGEFYSKNGFTYMGNDTVISNFDSRIKYYNTNKDFYALGEVITCEFWTFYANKNITNNDFAKILLNNFIKSPEHNSIISGESYNVVAINVKLNENTLYLTMVVGLERGKNN